MPLEPMAGAIAGLGALVAILSVRWLIALARSTEDESPLQEATRKTGRWSIAIIGAVAGLAATGLVEFNALIMGAVEFVATHPYFASNLGVGALGAGAVSGVLNVSTSQYVGIAIALVGVVFLVVEVDNA